MNIASARGSPRRRGRRHERVRRSLTANGVLHRQSVCIGCKACEVACKEWSQIPEDGLNWTGMSHDDTGGLGADSWRHVSFVEQSAPGALPEHARVF